MRLMMPPSRRHSVRRAVDLPCAVRSELWSGPLPLSARDLSPDGLWLSSPLALDPGSQLVLAFRPPRWPLGRWPVLALGEVVRADLRRRRSDAGAPGMGVRFIDIADADRDRMHATLRGLPPPLPRRPRPERIVRVDTETTFALDDGQAITFGPLGPLLTLGRTETADSCDESTLPHALRLAC